MDPSWAYNLWKFVTDNLQRYFPIADFIPGVNASSQFVHNFLAYGMMRDFMEMWNEC